MRCSPRRAAGPRRRRQARPAVFEATLIAAIAGVAWVATIDVASPMQGSADDGLGSSLRRRVGADDDGDDLTALAPLRLRSAMRRPAVAIVDRFAGDRLRGAWAATGVVAWLAAAGLERLAGQSAGAAQTAGSGRGRLGLYQCSRFKARCLTIAGIRTVTPLPRPLRDRLPRRCERRVRCSANQGGRTEAARVHDVTGGH